MSNICIQYRILFVTPGVSFIPSSSKHIARNMATHGERIADDLAGLFVDLCDLGVDVHVAQPDYRRIFSDISKSNLCRDGKMMPCDRMHLTEDRAFFYSNCPRSNNKWENIKISLAFHREVINHILPLVQPDLIHCHGWMTGLIPAMARDWGIPCIFTFQSYDTAKSLLSDVEDMGIDAARFWQHLYFDRFPVSYEETRETNPIDFLLSGIFAADYVNVAADALFAEIDEVQNSYGKLLRQIIANKLRSGSAAVHSNYSFNPQQYIDLCGKMLQRPLIKIKRDDSYFYTQYHHRGKKINKTSQKRKRTSDSINPVLAAG